MRQPREVAAREVTPSPIRNMREYQAYAQLLMDRGHWEEGSVTFGGDEDSDDFVQEVRRLNPTWKPGQTPAVPSSGPELRVSIHAKPGPRMRLTAASVLAPKIASVSAPRRPATTSRVRPRGRRSTPGSSGSRDDPDEDDAPGGAGPPLHVIPPAEFRRWLLHELGGSG